jgi:AbiV family abortive infection protein
MSIDDNYHKSRIQVVNGMHLCLSNVRELLKSVESLIIKNCDSSITLGLYTFAIEEFGKAIHLKSHIKRLKKKYSIPKRIFYDHDFKFNKALSVLPIESKSPVRGVKIDSNTNPSPQTVELSSKDGNKIIISPYATGVFSLIDYSEADFETRLSSFYVDWNTNTNMWKIKPLILTESITRGVFKFNQFLNNWEKSVKRR